jgi:protocatechuate 3,4-dioxygenase beta subunit
MKFSFPLAYCALLATVLAAQTSTTQAPSKESKSCIVQGQVILEPGGHPLSKVTVQLYSEDEGDKSYEALTDAEGSFKIEDVKPGHYDLNLERNGLLQPGKYPGRYYSQTVTLKPGQELKDLLLRMQPAAVITGKIVDAEGDPVVNANVEIIRPRAGLGHAFVRFHRDERTNDLGEYRLAGLPPGGIWF